MAKKITLKNKNGDVLCPHTAIEQVRGLKEALDGKLSLSGGTLTGNIKAPAFRTTLTSGEAEAVMAYPVNISWGNDLNGETYLKAGMYQMSSKSNTLNQPSATGYGNVITVKGDAEVNKNNAGQIYLDSNGVSSKAYIRAGQVLSEALAGYHITDKTWREVRFMDDLVTTSHIAKAAITPEKIQTSIALNGTPSMTVEPTTSSPDKTIASVGLVKEAVDGIEIGGTNLILNSDFSKGVSYWNPLYITSTTVFSVENNIASFTLGVSDATVLQTSAILFEVGQKYTVSFDCRSDEYTALDYCYFIGQEGQGNKSFYIYGITSEWKRIIYTFTSDISGLYRFGFGANRNRNTAGSFQLRKVKLERGNKASDWSPAPEDVEAKIDDKLGKEEKAVSAADADKLEGATKDDILQEASKESVRVAGDNWTEVGKVYVDGEIAKVKNGDVVIPSASETIYGTSRLAKLDDVTSQNDSSSNDDNVAVTPNVLWRYMLQEKTDIQEQIDGKLGKTEKAADSLLADIARNVSNGAITQSKIGDGAVTTSKIANTAVTSTKIENDVILNGTPSMTVEPTTSSPDKTIASVGLVKEAVDGIEIDTRNLLSDSEEITIDGSALTSGTKYEVRKLPISVAVGDVLTFNCEDLIINAGTGQTHAIVLRVPGVGALAPMQWISPTSKTATITVTQASDTPHLYIYAGYADDSAGKSITYKGATLVKGDKPMLLWQPSVEDVEAKIAAANPTIFLQTLQPSATEVKEGDIWIIQ